MTGTLNAPVLSGTIISGDSIYSSGVLLENYTLPTTINVDVLSGTTISGNTYSIIGNMTPTTSGTSLLGSSALPFSGIYANQYATSLYSQILTGTSGTVNWNNGASQKIDFTGGVSGTCTLTLSNPIAGSAYVLTTLQNTSGTTSLIWPTVKWLGGVSGTMTAASGTTDMFNLYYDGTNYLGSFGSNYF